MGKNIVTDLNVEIADGKYVINSYAMREIDLALLSFLLTNATFLQDSQLLFTKPAEFVLNVRYYPLMLSNYLDSVNYISWVSNNLENVRVGGKNYKPDGNNYLQGVNLQKNRRLTKLYKVASTLISRITNDFFDYAPYTKLRIYLPYVKWIELNIDEVIGKYITFYFNIDFYNGSITYYITRKDTSDSTDETYVTECSGQIGIDVPIGSTNANDIAKNILALSFQTGISAVTLGASGLVKGIAGGMLGVKAIGTIGNVGSNLLHQLQKQGGLASSLQGALTNLRAPTSIIILREYVNPISADANYKHLVGLPMNEASLLSSLSGYTEVGVIHFNPMNENIYQDEITEIVDLLQKGVVL